MAREGERSIQSDLRLRQGPRSRNPRCDLRLRGARPADFRANRGTGVASVSLFLVPSALRAPGVRRAGLGRGAVVLSRFHGSLRVMFWVADGRAEQAHFWSPAWYSCPAQTMGFSWKARYVSNDCQQVQPRIQNAPHGPRVLGSHGRQGKLTSALGITGNDGYVGMQLRGPGRQVGGQADTAVSISTSPVHVWGRARDGMVYMGGCSWGCG